MSQTKAQLIDPVDGTIVNADINASAAIAGSKISPDFGSQNITTTGIIKIADGSVSAPALAFTDDLDTGIFSVSQNTINFTTSGVERLEIGTSLTVFNDGGADVDFRIEGSGEDNLFKVDAGNDRIGIGTSSPDNLLHLFESSTTQTADASSQLVIEKNSNSGITILSGNVHNGRILFGDSGDNDIGQIDYDHNSNYLRFVVNGGERLRIDSSGNVGIGTTSPSRKLHVDSSFIRVDDGYGLDSSGSSERVTLDNGFVSLTTNSTERIRIDSSGRLLHGVTTNIPVDSVAGAKLQVHNNASVITASFTGYGAHAGGSVIALGKSRSSTVGDGTGAVQNGDTLGDIRFGGSDGTDMVTTACAIRGEVDGSVSSNTIPGRLEFSTNGTERLRIGSSGNVTVKTDDVALSGSGTLRINSGSTAGALNLDGGSTNHGGEINLTGGSNGGQIQFRSGAGAGQQSERMRIAATGDVLIATTSASIFNDNTGGGFNFKSDGQFVLKKQATSAADPLVWLNDTGQTTNKSIVFAQDGSEKANIGLAGNDATITVNGSERMRVTSDGRLFIGSSNPAASTNADDLCIGNNDGSGETGITLGSNTASGIRWADGSNNSAAVLEYQHNNTRFGIASEGSTRLVIDSDGIKFNGDTAAANGLDDYEEGTFTPTSSAITLSGTIAGHYTKIGDLCYVSTIFQIPSTSNTSDIEINGLPFNAKNGTDGNFIQGGYTIYHNQGSPHNVLLANNNNQLVLYKLDGQRQTFNNFSNKHLRMAAVYKVA